MALEMLVGQVLWECIALGCKPKCQSCIAMRWCGALVSLSACQWGVGKAWRCHNEGIPCVNVRFTNQLSCWYHILLLFQIYSCTDQNAR